MAEGEKALAEAKSTFDNPLAEPESAPQIAAEPQPAAAEVEAPSSVAEAPSEPDGAESSPLRRSEPLPRAGTGRRTRRRLQPKRSRPKPRPPAEGAN